ncbi:MAG: BTAD domain-containing putative transcriptional regulator, partial [Cyanobacteria bacterium P01_F01_bin.3]
MSPSLRITLFGQLNLSVDGTAITAIKSERLQALLAFLLLHRDAPQSRQTIAIHLWPDSTDANAKANLRKRLHELKKHIPNGDRYLKVQPQTVQWIVHEDCWVDVAAFDAAITRANSQANSHSDAATVALEEAVRLYQGALLPSCYDDWIEPQRDRLRQQAMSALDTLIPQLAKQARINEAIHYAQQLQQLDPLYERAYFHLMQLHAQRGARAIALRIYHQCMTILRDELGVDPSPETRKLHEALLQGTPVSDEHSDNSFDEPGPSSSKGKTVAEPTVEQTAKATVTQTAVANTTSPDVVTAVKADPIATSTDWGEAPDVSFFYGRSAEIEQLQTWIMGIGTAPGKENRSQLIAVLGMGGIGKTSLVAKVAHNLQNEFDYVIWRSLRNAPPLETLLSELVPFLSNQQDTACSVPRLMHWLRQSRCLVILDNLETLLKEGERAGQFREEYENYSNLIQVLGQGKHQSALVITSREKPAEISTFEGMGHAVQSLQLAGSPEAALALLDASTLTGTQAQKEMLGKRYGYSPLALQIVGGSIRDIFDGDISLFLAEDTLLFNGAKKLLDLQFKRL